MLRRLLLLLLISLFLCGCNKNSKEEITFASWGSATEIQILKKIITDFEKENPDIKISFMHIPQNYFQKMHLLFASNTPPDVLFINNLYLPLYSSYLEDLSSYTNKEQFYPQAIEGLSADGKILAIPRDISNQVFYVNLDKTTLPDNKWTLDDLTRVCSGITKNGTFCVSYEDKVYWLKPYLSYFGGSVLDKDKNLSIGTEQSKKAINFYKDSKTKYHYAPTKSEIGSSTLAQMFIDGKIVFYLSGKWMYPKISETAKFKWAVINFPYGENPQEIDTSGWAIAKSSKHKEAAVKLVQFLSDKESSEYFTKTGLIVPARIDNAGLLNDTKHNEHIFAETITKSIASPVCKDYGKLMDKLNNSLDL